MTIKSETIGIVFVARGTRFRNNSEFARWFDEIEIAEDCKVDLVADVNPDGQVVDWYGPRFSVEGPVVASDWSPCFGGVPFASKVDQNLGEMRKHTCAWYAHALAAKIFEGKVPHVTLIGFEAVAVDYVYQGEPRRTYRLRRTEEQKGERA